MSDENSLVYMRARYYSPTLKRFINADVVAGSITNSITLNRYAYANGNPVSNVDPFGMSADNRGSQGTPIGYGQINPFAGLRTEEVVIEEPMQGKFEQTKDFNSSKNLKRKSLDWSEATLEEMWFDTLLYLIDESKIGDNEYALYDNYRNKIDGIFHEQIFYVQTFTPSLATSNKREMSLGFSGFKFELHKGAWEKDNVRVGLLNIIKAEVTADLIKPKVSAFISMWNPEASITGKVFKLTAGADVGVIGPSSSYLSLSPGEGSLEIRINKGLVNFNISIERTDE